MTLHGHGTKEKHRWKAHCVLLRQADKRRREERLRRPEEGGQPAQAHPQGSGGGGLLSAGHLCRLWVFQCPRHLHRLFLRPCQGIDRIRLLAGAPHAAGVQRGVDVPPGTACAAAGVVRHAPPGAGGRAAPPDAGQGQLPVGRRTDQDPVDSGTGHVQRRPAQRHHRHGLHRRVQQDRRRCGVCAVRGHDGDDRVQRDRCGHCGRHPQPSPPGVRGRGAARAPAPWPASRARPGSCGG